MIKIKNKSYNVAWDALATIEFIEACGFKYLDEVNDLRVLFGMNGKEDERISTTAMRNLVHFCHVALKTADPLFPFSYRELFNELNNDPELTKQIMAEAMDKYVSASNVPVEEGEGKVMAVG